MSWSTDYFNDATYMTTGSSISGGMNTYYDRKFLKRMSNALRFAPLGQRRNLPKGAGKIIQFFRYNDISMSASSRYLTEGKNPNGIAVTGQNISATLSEWGGFSQHSSLVMSSHIDRNLEGVAELWGDDAGNLIDLLCQMEFASCGAYPVRCDGNIATGDYVYFGTVTSSTSTTVFADTSAASNTDFGDANDDFNQSVCVFLTGTAKGQARPVSDYATSGGSITLGVALDVKAAVGDTFVVVSAHGLTSSNVLSTTNIRNAVTILRNNKAMPLSGGYYVGVLCPDTEKGLMADTNWTNVMQYRDRPDVKVNGLFAGEVGEWGGVRWVRTTQPFRFPITTVGTAGSSYGVGTFVPGTSYTNYATTAGNLYMTPIVGQECFGVSTFVGEAGNILRPRIIVKNPGPNDTSNPLNRFSTVGWTLPFIPKALNPLFGVQLWSGA